MRLRSKICYAKRRQQLRPGLIAMVRDQSFGGLESECPYSHLREFEQLCNYLVISGMSSETLRWLLFPFSLTGDAKIWCNQTVSKVEGSWEELKSSFCLRFFPPNKVVDLRCEVLSFRQRERESLGAAWARFNRLASSGPDLAIPKAMPLQHFV